MGANYPQKGKMTWGDFSKIMISLELTTIANFCLHSPLEHSLYYVCAKFQANLLKIESTIDFLRKEN